MISPGIILFLAIIHLYIDWIGIIRFLLSKVTPEVVNRALLISKCTAKAYGPYDMGVGYAVPLNNYFFKKNDRRSAYNVEMAIEKKIAKRRNGNSWPPKVGILIYVI